MSRPTIRRVIFDSEIRKLELAIEQRQPVLMRSVFDLVTAAGRPTVAVGATPISLLQEALVVALQLVVETMRSMRAPFACSRSPLRKYADVDVIHAEARQRVRQKVLQRCGARVHTEPASVRSAQGAELHREHGLAMAIAHRAADQQFVVPGAVVVAGVKERDARVKRSMDGGDALALVGRTVRPGHAHATECQRKDRWARGPESTRLMVFCCCHPPTLDRLVSFGKKAPANSTRRASSTVVMPRRTLCQRRQTIRFVTVAHIACPAKKGAKLGRSHSCGRRPVVVDGNPVVPNQRENGGERRVYKRRGQSGWPLRIIVLMRVHVGLISKPRAPTT